MPVSMLVKCEKCGYENFPQHRFCGMCAAELRLPGPGGNQPGPAPSRPVAAPTVAAPRVGVAAPKARDVVPQPVSGPSFLGLANEPAENRNVSYLLEDEPGPSHTGRNLVLLIALAGAIAAGWHWRVNLVSLVSKFSSNAAGNTQANTSVPAGSDSTSPAAPATGANASTPVGNQGAVADTQTPAAQGQTPPPVPPATGAADSSQSPQADQSQPSQSQAGDSAGAAKNDESDETASQPAPPAKSPKVRAQATTPPISRADELEAEGEKYLYGNGVPENCTRARTSLMAAAQHSNAQAQNVLGTMYATGHCATRDLPTAYRWFSRSLRKDPNNTRIEQDLKVLWNQMTPEERQLALRDQR